MAKPSAHAVLAGAEVAHVVAAAGPLDLDDVGAEVGQHHGAVRAGDDPREVEDADAVEHQERSRKPSVIALTSGMPARAMALMRAFISASGLNGFLAMNSAYSRAAFTSVAPGHDPVDQPPLPRLLGGVAPAVHDDLLGARRADQPDEPRGGGDAERHAEVDLGDPQLGFGGRDAEVAGQREPPAAADGVAVDGRDGRLLEALQHGVGALEEPPELALARAPSPSGAPRPTCCS